MPILPPQPVTAYDSATTVLNMARARANDELKTLQPTSGKLLDLGQATTQQHFNTAWRKCQSFLGDKGYSRLNDEIIVPALPVVSNIDPASQCWLSWFGFFDGNNVFNQITLPANFSHPIKIWERWSGQNLQFGDPPMEKMLAGIPAVAKTTTIRFWEWRNDAIYMPGSLMSEDLRIKCCILLPDIVDVSGVPWFVQAVPIVRVADGLSYFILAEVAYAKEDDARGDALTGKGEAALVRVFNLDVKADQYVNIRRKPRTGGRGFGRTWY